MRLYKRLLRKLQKIISVDCKAKMEGMIPIEEFKNDDELEKIKIGSQIDVYLERIESFKGEIVVSEIRLENYVRGRNLKKFLIHKRR